MTVLKFLNIFIEKPFDYICSTVFYLVNKLFFIPFFYEKVYDPWLKLQSGILKKILQDVGNFDECIKFKHGTSNSTLGLIKGKYCVTRFQATQQKLNSTDDKKTDLT